MSEIEITLPTVAYGNVKVRATPEELGVELSSPAALGTATAIFLNLFTQGFAVGASMDVTASPTEGLSAPRSYWEATNEEHAKELLNEGLGGVTEVPAGDIIAHEVEENQYDRKHELLSAGLDEYDSATEAKEAAQARTADAAPWNNPQVDAKPKPWETDGKAPKAPVVTADW